ncbi:MAG: DUF192 domain-containing protein [Terracidiphilus sp.]|nr:DUF192 domain-containing protein [Terracidiphilus sp.]
MEKQRFCVYNQTSECFLSLGVVAANTLPARLKTLIGRRTLHYDEGLWVTPSTGFHTFTTGISAPIDLLYLDQNHRAVHVVESFPRLRIAPLKSEAASLLALPAHTIYSSQTQRGDQLVICVAEEMEFRLRGDAGNERAHENSGFEPQISCDLPLRGDLQQEPYRERRRLRRQMWPRLVAYDWNGANLVVHGIRDASATGLYLLTEKRWPLGTLVTMNLQKASSGDESAELTITVQLKVIRWGKDGVGLEYVLPETLDPAQWIEKESTGDEPIPVPCQDEKVGTVQ